MSYCQSCADLTARLASAQKAIVERDRMTDEAITYWKGRLASAEAERDTLKAVVEQARQDEWERHSHAGHVTHDACDACTAALTSAPGGEVE
jgi:hypothetical protein